MIQRSRTVGVVEALGLERGPGLVSIVGGGGKSSLLFALARELPGRIVMTTTTRIFAAQMKRADEVCTLMQSRASETGVTLTSESDPAAGQFEADPRAVRSLLVNLVENSLDACRLDGEQDDHEVVLRVIGFPDHVHYEVQDNGIGIRTEDQGMIFERFYRADDPVVQEASGTGLGLSIVRGLTEAMGGRVWYEPTVGGGATFTVALPIRTGARHQDG